jgi:HEAT repeat protein
MVTAFLLLLALLQDAPQDRLAPILQRWRSGGEEERLRALRDAAALRPETGDAALAPFADPPVPTAWTRADDLLDLVSREKLASWYGLLVPLLSHRDPLVRVRALDELGRRDLARFSGSVVPRLKDEDGRVAWQAAYTLIQMDARDRVPDLAPLLKDPAASLRPNVLHALLRLGTRAHAPIVEPFLADADPAVAIAAVQILGQIGSPDSAPKVLRFLESPEPSQRQAAVAALAGMGARNQAKKIAERLDDEQTLVRWEAIRALGRLRARDYADRIGASLKDDGGLAPGLEALGAFGLRASAPRILPFLETPDPGIRWRAVRALGDVDATDDAARIAGMLKDPDSYVRLCALRALAALGARDHAGKMLELLRDEEAEVAQAAAEEASLLASPDQVRAVVPLLEDGDSFVRYCALRFLVRAGATEALPAIAARLGKGPVLDRDVVWAIGRLGGKEYRDQVAAAVMNDDELVRQQAVFALARIAPEAKELEAADRSAPGPTQLAAGVALARLGRKTRAEAAALLREYLRHRDEPEYQLFPDELFDALTLGFSPESRIIFEAPYKTGKRIETAQDVMRLGRLDVPLDLRILRRLPAGSTGTARRGVEWCLGSDVRLVPRPGAVLVTDSPRALEFWKNRLDSP